MPPLTQNFHFLLLPEFSVMGFVSAIEPLRVANRFHEGAYRWHILSLDGGPVVASNGMSINAEAAFPDAGPVQAVFVVAGFNPLAFYRSALADWLRRAHRHGAKLGAIDTGAFVLAQAGLLGDEPVTLHWEALSAFAEQFPDVTASGELFEIGQRTRYGLYNRKTIQVVKLMQEHIEDPLTADDLAAAISVTRRQMERLFATHMHETPARFYAGVRLDRARELLRQTGMGILAVGVACGFGSSSSFSRAYRMRFGQSPKDERAR